MPQIESTRIQLRDRLARTLHRIEALEAAYETITVGQLVSLRARTHGSTTAIDVFERGERLTYKEVDCLSNKYAHGLRAVGVRKGDRVAVMLPNRSEMPITWFALAKLGAIMVPINMRYTSREVAYVLSETKAKFAIVDESAWTVFSTMDPWPQTLANERVFVAGSVTGARATALNELVANQDASLVEQEVGHDDLLNIQYTSGTSGFPKGCMLTHDYWCLNAFSGAHADFEPYKNYLSTGPFTYAESLGILIKSYRQGGTLYIAPQLSSTRFLDWLAKYKIEWCWLPELIAKQALDTDELSPALKEVGYHGGWSPETIRRFRERFGVRGQAAYGMTEIAWGTLLPAEISDLDDAGSNGIRSPFRQLRLVSEDGAPTPLGEIGELWVKGRGIFKGYCNNPEANAAAFEGEWFKTGDLMRSDENGFYWLVGRKKDMIRRSNENIAAREVEAIIREMPGIEDVAAVPVKDTKRGEEVKIYVELKQGVTPEDLPVERILDHARARLAAFKVPRYIAFSAGLPRANTINKVLKRELMMISDPISGAYDSEEKRWR